MAFKEFAGRLSAVSSQNLQAMRFQGGLPPTWASGCSSFAFAIPLRGEAGGPSSSPGWNRRV
eukprot:13651492-Alexandrium_andersonii.AAC.1